MGRCVNPFLPGATHKKVEPLHTLVNLLVKAARQKSHTVHI